MEKNAASVFMDRWMNDPAFPRQLRADPAATLRSCGIEPEEQLVRSLKDVDSRTPAEELQKRVSKALFIKFGR